MGNMSKEMQRLQTRADDATRLEAELKEATVEQARIEGLYKTEQVSTVASVSSSEQYFKGDGSLPVLSLLASILFHGTEWYRISSLRLLHLSSRPPRAQRVMRVKQLRKKYWNMIEDMKGKIRVFARCRPMAR